MRKKTVAGTNCSDESPFMPDQADNYEPTEEVIDMIVEETTGKPVKPADLAAGIASMQRRVAQLEMEKTGLLDRMDEDADESLKDHLAAVNKDLAIARERLAHYEAQVAQTVLS